MIKQLSISTDKHNQVIDITSRVNDVLSQSKVGKGLCTVSAQHTTCCLTTADLDPGTGQDLLDAIKAIFPEGDYRHPHDPSHVGEHIMSSLIGPSVSLPVKNSSLQLGTWQKLVLVELSGPRQRNLLINIQPE